MPTENQKTMNNYTEFLRQKIKMANFAGFDVQPSDLSPILYPHQRDIDR